MSNYKGVDLDKLKGMSGYVRSRGSAEWFKLEEDDPTMIRILPIDMVYEDLEVPLVPQITHAKEAYPSRTPNWQVGDGTRQICCLRAHEYEGMAEGTECPVCQLLDYLEENGQGDTELAKGIEPQKKFMCNILELNAKTGHSMGLKIWSMPGSVFNTLKKVIDTAGNIFDPDRGFNLVISKGRQNRGGPIRYTILTDPEGRSKIKDIKGAENWQKKVVDPRQFISVFTEAEILDILNSNLGKVVPLREVFGSSFGAKGKTATPKGSAAAKVTKATKKVGKK